MKPTPNELSDLSNRTSFYNDHLERLWINKVYNKLPKLFEAIVLSGTPEQSNSPNVGAVTQADIQEVNDNRYYFVRVRPLKTADLIIPNPFFAANLNDAKRLINMHPLAYVEVNNTMHPPTHGDVFECKFVKKDKLSIVLTRRLRSSGFKIGKIANRNLHKAYNNMSPMLNGPGRNLDDIDLSQYNITFPDTSQFDNPYGLKPKKGVYLGSFPPGSGTGVLNGFPVHGKQLLQVPDTRYWKLVGSGTGALLKDFIGGFNMMAQQFFNDFGQKFRCSGIRDFKTQILVRRNGVPSKCPSMTASGCSTARPGTSNHGWGQAIDIKRLNSSNFLRFSSPEYEWMVKNAGKYGWGHPKWAQRGGSMPEPWHWEPINKVVKVL